jgi:hypothetical protein
MAASSSSAFSSSSSASSADKTMTAVVETNELKEKDFAGRFRYCKHRRPILIANNPNATLLQLTATVNQEWANMPQATKQPWIDNAPAPLVLCVKCNLIPPAPIPQYETDSETAWMYKHNPICVSFAAAAAQQLCTLCWAKRMLQEQGQGCDYCGSKFTTVVRCMSGCGFEGKTQESQWCYVHDQCVSHCHGCVGWNLALCRVCFLAKHFDEAPELGDAA